jgi:putative protein-disulfide isomerase
MDAPHLIYFSDPMCSWCYGFSPVVESIRATFGEGLPIRLVMGGLRPGTQRPLNEAGRAEIRSHWEHVREATGQPFSHDLLDREGFVYDTDPAARAVIVARREGHEMALTYLARAQAAFYAEARDVTQPDVLADLAEEVGMDRADFLAAWSEPDAKNETWGDYAVSQRAGVTGFPTLVAGPNAEGVYGVVTRGYAAGEPVLAALKEWRDRIGLLH